MKLVPRGAPVRGARGCSGWNIEGLSPLLVGVIVGEYGSRFPLGGVGVESLVVAAGGWCKHAVGS